MKKRGEETVVSDVTARKTAARRSGRRAVPLLWPLKNSNQKKNKTDKHLLLRPLIWRNYGLPGAPPPLRRPLRYH